jgi:hypothetical protein
MESLTNLIASNARTDVDPAPSAREGWNLLVADCSEKIVNAVRNFASQKKSARKSLGDGKAAIKIASILLENLGLYMK